MVRDAFFSRALRVTLLPLLLCACSAASVPLHDDASTDAPSQQGVARLYTVLVAHVLHDFPSLPNKQWSKVEVFFEGAAAVEPEDVERIFVTGPAGFGVEIANVPFVAPIINGYVDNAALGGLWYQLLLPGYLAEGRYVVHVDWRDGRRETLARTLRTNTELLTFYETNKTRMTYEPTGTSDADDTVLRWSTLADLGGPDAFYNAWLSPGTAESIDPNTAIGDTIFAQAAEAPNAGRNLDRFRASDMDRPLQRGPHTWQVEILDANVLADVNAIIFATGQLFDAR
jgi:hypothetical protein